MQPSFGVLFSFDSKARQPMSQGDLQSGPVHLIQDEVTGDRILLYGTESGTRLELRYDGDSLWMTQAQMAELFGVDVRTVNEHLINAYEDGELSESPTIRKFRIVRTEGGREVARDLNHYNLDAVISVGYRVSSKQGTLFRKWATGVLVRFATKGFVIDVPRLKNPEEYDRISELREIVREIRTSEANLYAEIRRICAMCQDYDPQSEAWRDFYACMQAKLFWAVTTQTPSMILVDRASASEPNMGLQTWPKPEIRKSDVLIAKNYLAQSEIKELNRLTDILLSIFEDQLAVGKLTTMQQATRLMDEQLRSLGRQLLRHGGNVKHSTAERHVELQYARFDKKRREARRAEADAQLARLKTTESRLPKKRKAS